MPPRLIVAVTNRWPGFLGRGHGKFGLDRHDIFLAAWSLPETKPPNRRCRRAGSGTRTAASRLHRGRQGRQPKTTMPESQMFNESSIFILAEPRGKSNSYGVASDGANR